MGIIVKSLIQKQVPFPMVAGNRIAYTPGTQNTTDKMGLLRYYADTVWTRTAVSTIATSVAQVEWRLYRNHKGGGEREEIDDHELLDLIKHPNPFQSGAEFRELHQVFTELLGECYHIKQNNQGKRELWIPIVPFMSAIPDATNYIGGYKYDIGNGVPVRTFKTDEVIAFWEINPLNPLSGIGRAQSAALDIESLSMMEQYNRNFFYWDASAGTIITYPTEANITPDELNRLMDQWNAGHRSYGRAHRAAILTQGATIAQSGSNNKDMDFVNLDKSVRDKILASFGISYSNVGGVESVNRANAEAQLLNFARGVMVPRLNKIKAKWNTDLTPEYGEDLELDYDNPVPEDTAAQASVIDNHIKSSLMSIEEGRQALDMGDIQPDEHFLIPINMQVKTGDEILNPPPEPEMPAQLPPGANPAVPPTKIYSKKSMTKYRAKLRAM